MINQISAPMTTFKDLKSPVSILSSACHNKVSLKKILLNKNVKL